MIHRESGVLCDATSLALNVFDILEGDAIRRQGRRTRTSHWIVVVKDVDFKIVIIKEYEKKRVTREDGPSSQPIAFQLKGSGQSVGYGKTGKQSHAREGRDAAQRQRQRRRADGPRGQSLDPCPPHTEVPSLACSYTASILLSPSATVVCPPGPWGNAGEPWDHGEKTASGESFWSCLCLLAAAGRWCVAPMQLSDFRQSHVPF